MQPVFCDQDDSNLQNSKTFRLPRQSIRSTFVNWMKMKTLLINRSLLDLQETAGQFLKNRETVITNYKQQKHFLLLHALPVVL